jgi:fibro-slime domain-containing protein
VRVGTTTAWVSAALLALGAWGCSADATGSCRGGGRCTAAGSGGAGGVAGVSGAAGVGGAAGGSFDNTTGAGTGGPGGTGGAPVEHVPDAGGSVEVPTDCETKIVAIVRDFRIDHPDFEMDLTFNFLTFGQGEKNAVKPALEMGFPAYAFTGASPGATFTGPLEFYQWYVDDPAVNQRFEVPLPFTEPTPGRFVFDSAAFFPIDNMGFGNEGNPHNFHFTTEVRTEFTYQGGEVFTFRGDDDLWMFVNGQRVIDLGGLHGALEATVDMDAEAARIGLVIGETYPMDIFHAERHTSESNYRIETNIKCFTVVEPPPPPPPPVVQ